MTSAFSTAFRATVPAIAVLLAGLSSAVAGDTPIRSGWTEIGPSTAQFGPVPVIRLGAIVTAEMAGPVVILRTVKGEIPIDREAFLPYLTGTPAPVMAQGED
ncbi:hypothetical protein CCR97_08510 [Rhodoplanes elegans]|uniref:Uncharacterized protein n=1 Tax=Rhodoplanes elegans TaxID=29408 RepID=A0A327KPY1_9BRAD|nr:hypothetical protein [Rhodoplanes elegans]MBK5958251.1 hypothetical protein [Rhodoplanes elegans]RAI40034.1 hypothetical protein CH338_07560 [Rhodoplanes elegans]